MARHNEILNKFKTIQPVFDFTNKDHKEVVSGPCRHPRGVVYKRCFFFQLMKIMVKVSDISNEVRPMAVAEPWLDCLLQEFFNQVFKIQNWVVFRSSGLYIKTFFFSPQSDTEKLKGLPVTPFMDRDKVSKPSCQTSFIRFVLLPLFTELIKLFPCLEVTPARYSELLNINAAQLKLSPSPAATYFGAGAARPGVLL